VAPDTNSGDWFREISRKRARIVHGLCIPAETVSIPGPTGWRSLARFVASTLCEPLLRQNAYTIVIATFFRDTMPFRHRRLVAWIAL